MSDFLSNFPTTEQQGVQAWGEDVERRMEPGFIFSMNLYGRDGERDSGSTTTAFLTYYDNYIQDLMNRIGPSNVLVVYGLAKQVWGDHSTTFTPNTNGGAVYIRFPIVPQ